MMRILHAILSRGFYGSERYCIELALAQARAGHDVAILLEGHSVCARRFAEAIAATDTGRGTLRRLQLPSWAPAVLHRPLARRMIRRFAPDVVHTHLNPAARRIGRQAQTLRIPHVATLHLRYDPREHGTCDGLIAIASWQRAQIPADHPGKTTVVWNWLPARIAHALGCAKTAQAAVALRAAWAADESTLVFGSVGRLEPEKGMDRLISAFRRAFPRGEEPVRLVIVGDGSQMADLRRRAAGDPRILFAGAQDEVAPFYEGFDIYVSAARFEPFGLAILEAMAAGCRLLLTRTEGPREFVSDPRVGWVEPEDDGALLEALRRVSSNERQRLVYDLSALAPERAAAAIEEFYARVVKRSARPQRPRNSDAR
jgi:glycosyltransferase involved in cell wall biosynthesis